MQRRSGCIAWFIIVAAVVALLLTWQYVGYRRVSRTLPAGMTMAGLSAEGMTREQALNALEVAYATPLTVTYQEHELSLPPESVGLGYNADKTAANLDAALAPWRGLDGFIAHVLRRSLGPVDVRVAVSYSDEQLDSFLNHISSQYDRPPQGPVPLPASLTFRLGRPGSRLNGEASRAVLADALVSADEEQVTLDVETQQAPSMDLDLLGKLLQTLLDDHPNLIPGIFVKDLQSGDELSINAEVPYAGLSVLKIAVLEETYRSLDEPPGVETTKLISETVTKSGNFTANLLLRDVIDDGDGYQGTETLTGSMQRLGLRNTFMAAPYDEEDVASTVVTPANSRADVATEPDPVIQTTPLDVGLLLEMVYQCSHGGGALIAAYPDALTANECSRMIEWLSKNQIDSLIEAGVPVGTEVAHKQGWRGDTHADAALVLSPGGDFVLVVFLYHPQWLEWEESAPLIADIATATYNYFNPAQ